MIFQMTNRQGRIPPPGLGVAMPRMRQPNSKFGINSDRLRSITGENLGLLGTLKKYPCHESGMQKFFFNSLKCLLSD